MRDRTAKCMCGAVRMELKDVPDTFSTCYCETCQRWGGGPLRGVTVKNENLKVEGLNSVGTLQTSAFAERAFCTKCGSSLWYKLIKGPYVGGTSVLLGLLDDRSGLTVSYEMFTDYKDCTNEVPAGTKQMSKAEAEAIAATFANGEA